MKRAISIFSSKNSKGILKLRKLTCHVKLDVERKENIKNNV